MLPTTSQQGGEGGGAMETRRSRGPQWQRAGCREGWKMSLCVYLGRHRRPDSRARGRCSWALNRGPGLRWMAEAIEAIGAQEVKG